MTAGPDERWTVTLRDDPGWERRALLVPFAGAGPRSLRRLARALPGRWQVAALALPGRPPRDDEPLVRSLDALVAGAAPAVSLWVARGGAAPWVLFGHSMGAIVALHLARAVGSPGALVVSACAAPAVERPHRLLSRESDEALAAAVAALGPAGRVPPERLPALRADCEIVDALGADASLTSPAPVVALAALDDPLAPPATVAAWRAHHPPGAARPFEHVSWPRGGHFYVLDDPEPAARAIDATGAAAAT